MIKTANSPCFEFLDYRPTLADQVRSSDDEREISVKRDAFWSYCGPLLSSQEDLPGNLHDWAAAALSSSLLPLLLPFLTFANQYITRNGLDHYWLTIRATKAAAEFDKPRWHTDDMFFSGEVADTRTPRLREVKSQKLDLQTNWKLCTTLLGPSTMFIPLEQQAGARETQRATKSALTTDHLCTSIRCVGCAATADAVRISLDDELRPLGVVQAKKGECAFFRIGLDGGAVHSEPSMSGGDRIFINVVPGKKDELERLMHQWGMSFPRAWWIAPNVGRTP
ncbi:hypothetical protein F4778DRAFT_445093 [Xylariomycetidae sp. FL2044]|nr:hypothetical protein F4778DRAFT_445093 [Xylariomycetidae sp. FL2044]